MRYRGMSSNNYPSIRIQPVRHNQLPPVCYKKTTRLEQVTLGSTLILIRSASLCALNGSAVLRSVRRWID
ncbi:UNVERIFIED_CONTAM: hypothetical protein FKN15_009545 [Acipenser sinensis]